MKKSAVMEYNSDNDPKILIILLIIGYTKTKLNSAIKMFRGGQDVDHK